MCTALTAEFLDVADAAEFLRVKVATIYAWVHRRFISFRKHGRHVVFCRAELYIQAGASAEDIRRLLNQKSLTATDRYMHRTDERLRGIADLVRFKPSEPISPEPVRLRLVSHQET